jgi:ADP-ribose pyrophosphatase YjhB (NUDIX family)
MSKRAPMAAAPEREPLAQAAAIPWRLSADGRVEVLLITSRETGRWVIPKGWPIKGLNSARTAAREAFEEAGVWGEAAKKKLGVYSYEKRLRTGRVQHVKVSVYALRVEGEHAAWPEAVQRERLWASPSEAAELVQEAELATILRRFSPVAARPAAARRGGASD